MCGIVGVIGKKDTTDILLNGLQRLAYRGYDSAGIYVNNQNGKDFLVRRPGKIDNLRKAVTSDVQGTMGIGHTRWATHGEPTEANAHPQFSQDNRFYLVHNGVINNFQQIKNKYLSDVKFTSHTDTEVAVQLVDKIAVTKKVDAETALREALKIIDGSYSFELVDRKEPDKIFVAKNKSPLLIGLGKGFNVVCSDAMAMLDQTHTFLEIHDGEIGVVTKDSVKLSTIDGKPVKRDPYTISYDENVVSKGTYDSFMLKEIDEQPSVMRRIVSEYFDGSKITIDPKIIDDMNNSDRIYIVAAGTSYNSGLVGKQIFEKIADVPVEVEVASECGYHMPKLTKKPFFIFLSQSGETADSREVLVQVNKLGFHSLTMTNVQNSTLSREATYTLLLHAGPEIAVASTKAYTAQIAVQAITAKAMGEKKGLSIANNFDVKHQLALAANSMQEVVDEKDKIKQLALDYFHGQHDAFYIGRGNGYAVSLEGSLKLKEVSYVHAEGFAAGELKHGTIALIENNTPVVAFIIEESTAALTRGNIKEVASRGAHTLVISSKSLAQKGDSIVLDDLDESLMPLVTIVPTQLFAYYTAIDRGNDVDQPRNLAKSVTVE